MKVLVFSDSHGNTAIMCDVIRLEAPDRVLHLGDCVHDIQAVERIFPSLTVNYVRGNCDGTAPAPDVMRPILEEKKVFMTHGHLYQVKSDYDTVIWTAREEGADLLLFGHTHQAYAAEHGGMWVMNPGSCRGWGEATYGIVLVEHGQMSCGIKTI